MTPAAGAAEVLTDLVDRKAVARMFEGDHTLWRDDPSEIADRLGWIPVVAEVLRDLTDLRERADRLAADVDHVLVMGMGGSSLFPEVLARCFPPAPGRPQLHVLDTTHPAAIKRLAEACPPERTLHLASSKSGSTIETRSHLEWAWERAQGRGRFAVVTDPGSELGALARDRGFADVFENRSDIGGRYSALSLFGIVPALLAGVDVDALLQGGLSALEACGPDIAPERNLALLLAAEVGAAAAAGRDKLTFVLPDDAAPLGPWLEQLVAESLGKDGMGVVPVVGEQAGASGVRFGDDRVFAITDPTIAARVQSGGAPVVPYLVAGDPGNIGRGVVVAELAVALMGAAIGVQPFDQPDVAAAKAATTTVLDSGALPTIEPTPLADLLAQLRPGDHLALQAFVDPGSPEAAALEDVRTALRDRHTVAVTLGFGPRFLHSTGQLHKGGPSSIVCVQVHHDGAPEISIPGRDFGFGHLLAAQAAGDLATLQERGRRAGRVDLADLLREGT